MSGWVLWAIVACAFGIGELLTRGLFMISFALGAAVAAVLAAAFGTTAGWVAFITFGAVYFLVPADQLPGFFPGHEIGAMRMHYKHGVVSGVAGLVLIGAGIWTGRR